MTKIILLLAAMVPNTYHSVADTFWVDPHGELGQDLRDALDTALGQHLGQERVDAVRMHPNGTVGLQKGCLLAPKHATVGPYARCVF